MLADKDIQTIQCLLQDNNKIIKKDTKNSIVESEKMMLDEMTRMKGFITARIESLESNMRELNQLYKVTKLESDNTSLLLKIVADMQKEIEEIKQKIA